jgi:hypothetical protein
LVFWFAGLLLSLKSWPAPAFLRLFLGAIS